MHDIWITNADYDHWTIQLMVFDDTDDTVAYRRDVRINRLKNEHVITVRDVKVLNPMITLLFKLHRHDLQDKDCHDVSTLINALANNPLCPDSGSKNLPP